MDKVFVDTGAFLALANRADQYHEMATGHLTRLASLRTRLVTSNFVLDETYTRIRNHAGHSMAVAFGEKIRSGRELEIVIVDRTLEERAWEIFKKFSDHKFSYTDCTSFALMKKRGLADAFTFDDDFRILGFQPAPLKNPV